jgi:hypothetical protein
MFTQPNYLAILVAAIAAFVLAFVWYMPPVFGLRWTALTKRYTGLSDSDLAANLPMKFGLWFVGFLVNALALALLLNLTQAIDLTTGLAVGVIAGIGFGAVTSSWPPIYARQPIGIWLMNNGLFLLQQIVMAAILTLWR